MNNSLTFFSRVMGLGEVQRQSIVTLLSQVLVTLLGFIGTMYFAHAVGAETLGAYYLFMAYYSMIGIFTDGGLGTAAIKRISEGEEQNEFISAFFVVRTSLVILVVLGLIVLRPYFVDLNSSGAFIWLLLMLLLSIFHATVSYGIIGKGKMGVRSVCNFLGEISRISVQILAVYFGYGIAGLAGGFFAGLLLAAIIELRFFELKFVRFSMKHIKSLMTFSFWSFLTAGGILLYTNTDALMIGYFLTNADVGIYKVVFQFTTAAFFIASALVATLWPKISMWGKKNETYLLEESLSRALSFSMLLAIPIFAGGILIGDKLLYYFYGKDFTSGYSIMGILLLVQIASIFQTFFLNYLGALDHQKFAFKVTSISAVANIILNFLLIPKIGISGAALATLFTMILNTFLARQGLSRIISIRIERDIFINILKSALLMSIFLISYRWYINISNVWLTILPVFIGGVIYVISILRLDETINNEMKLIITQINLPWPRWL